MADTVDLLRDGLLALLLSVCAVTDLAGRRIYNALTYPALVAGGLLALLAGPGSLASAAAGAALCAAAFAPLVVAGGMGLGDLKMMAAVGALAGLRVATAAMVDAALAGGIMAIGVLAAGQHGGSLIRRTAAVPAAVWRALRTGGRVRLGRRAGEATIPYGVAIAAGTLAARWAGWPW